MVKSTTWKRGEFTHSFQLSSLWGVDVKLSSNIQKESLLAKALRAKTEKVTHITKHNGSWIMNIYQKFKPMWEDTEQHLHI